jgi:hypothetical protein
MVRIPMGARSRLRARIVNGASSCADVDDRTIARPRPPIRTRDMALPRSLDSRGWNFAAVAAALNS